MKKITKLLENKNNCHNLQNSKNLNDFFNKMCLVAAELLCLDL